MSDFSSELKGITNSKYGNGAVYSFFIGALVSNALPNIGDVVFFWQQKKLRDKWKKGEITANAFWRDSMIFFYGIPLVYWLVIGGIILGVKGDASKKIKIGATLIASSTIIGVIFKMNRDDKQQLLKEDVERKLLMENNPEVVQILGKPEYANISGQIIKPNKDGSVADKVESIFSKFIETKQKNG